MVGGPAITAVLRAWEQGDDEALERLLPMVYSELRGWRRHYASTILAMLNHAKAVRVIVSRESVRDALIFRNHQLIPAISRSTNGPRSPPAVYAK